MDDVLAQNDSLSYSTLYGLEFDVDAFVAKVEAVTADEVLRVAQKYALAENVYVASVVPKTWSTLEQLS
jgi:predicted Zn-dependent peptidase